MPQLSVFRKSQDHDNDGMHKSISAHHDLLAACPMLSLDQQFRPGQHQQQPQPSLRPSSSSSSSSSAGCRVKNMRTSKSDVLLSDVTKGCTQFGSCQIKPGHRASAATPTGGGTSNATSVGMPADRPSGFESLRKNSSSILSRIHALTTQKCLQLSHSRTLLPSPSRSGDGGACSTTSFLPLSASKCSMTSAGSAATFGVGANCRLCLCDIPMSEFYELACCGCTFCRQCVEQYIKIQILDGNVTIPCPDGQCSKKGIIGILELESLADSDLYNKYKRFKLNNEVDLDKHRTWCPTPGCETICAVTAPMDSGGNWPTAPIKCETCSKSYCTACKAEWKTDHVCKLYTKKRKPTWFLGSDDRIVFAEGEDAPIKPCPVCRIPIERDSGCAQMMCKKCKHVFCWYCLASLDDDFLLRHYDKGPCKDKLGHSRASVFWHRTQVIVIFVGGSLLMLLALPLLIIGAPFVLCCKCKLCDRCHGPNTDPDMPPVNL